MDNASALSQRAIDPAHRTAEEILKWATQEMKLHPSGKMKQLPSVEELKKVCRGSMQNVWRFLITNVKKERTVQQIKGNLVVHGDKTKNKREMDVTQRKALLAKRDALLSQVKEATVNFKKLQVEIQQLKQDIGKEESQYKIAHDSIRQLEHRKILLDSYDQQMVKQINIIREYTRRLKLTQSKILEASKGVDQLVCNNSVAANNSNSSIDMSVETSMLHQLRELCQHTHTHTMNTYVKNSSNTDTYTLTHQQALDMLSLSPGTPSLTTSSTSSLLSVTPASLHTTTTTTTTTTTNTAATANITSIITAAPKIHNDIQQTVKPKLQNLNVSGVSFLLCMVSITKEQTTQLSDSIDNIDFAKEAAAIRELFSSIASSSPYSFAHPQSLSPSPLSPFGSSLSTTEGSVSVPAPFLPSSPTTTTTTTTAPVQSVEQLLQQLRTSHFQRFMDTENNLNIAFELNEENVQLVQQRDQQLADLLTSDPEAQKLLRQLQQHEIEAHACAACLQLCDQQADWLQHYQRNFTGIQDLLHQKLSVLHKMQQKLDDRQSVVQWLIKHNARERKKFLTTATELRKYVQARVLPSMKAISDLKKQHTGAPQREVATFDSLLLDKCLLSSHTPTNNDVTTSSISVHELPIHQVHEDQQLAALLQQLQYPQHTGSEGLLSHVANIKHQVENLTAQFLLQNSLMKSAMGPLEAKGFAGDNPQKLKELDKLCKLTERKQKLDWLPPLTKTLQQAQQSLVEVRNVQLLLSDWWQQPALNCVPWVTVDGVNVQQWQDKLNSLLAQLHQHQK